MLVTVYQSLLPATLQDPAQIFPTAMWGNAVLVSLKLALPPTGPIVYSWVVSSYGECSVMCGEGWQARDVTCLDSMGNLVEDMLLCGEPIPATNR